MPGKCPMCGAPMKTNVCEYCGYEAPEPTESKQPEEKTQTQTEQPQPQQVFINNQTIIHNKTFVPVSGKSKLVALILCILFGYFGFHRFYVGKIGSGILYLFTFGFCGIGWIIDTILIALGLFRDAYGLPLAR